MTVAQWAQLADAVQSFTVAVAVLAGGAWASYQFITLRSVAKARADLEKARVEIDEARRRLHERGILNLLIEHEVLPDPAGSSRRVVAVVHMENSGNRTQVIDWESSGFTAIPVATDTGVAVPNLLTTRWDSACRSRACASHRCRQGSAKRSPSSSSCPAQVSISSSLTRPVRRLNARRSLPNRDRPAWAVQGQLVWNACTFVAIY